MIRLASFFAAVLGSLSLGFILCSASSSKADALGEAADSLMLATPDPVEDTLHQKMLDETSEDGNTLYIIDADLSAK